MRTEILSNSIVNYWQYFFDKYFSETNSRLLALQIHVKSACFILDIYNSACVCLYNITMLHACSTRTHTHTRTHTYTHVHTLTHKRTHKMPNWTIHQLLQLSYSRQRSECNGHKHCDSCIWCSISNGWKFVGN